MPDNSSNNIRVAKNTIYMYFRMFLILVVSLFTVRVVIQVLGAEDYGIYGAIGGVVLTLSFVTSVLTSASQRFFSVEIGRGDEGKLTEVFNSLLAIYSSVAVILLLVAESIGLWFVTHRMNIPVGRENCILWVYHFSVISFLTTLMANPFQALIIAHERMNVYAVVSIIEVLMKLLLVAILIFFPMDKLKLYSFMMFISTCIVQSFYIIYSRRKFRETKIQLSFNKNMIKDIFDYSSWTLFGSLAFICNTQGINILLNLFFGPIANAAYSVGNQVKTQINSFSTNFFVAVRPAMIKSYAKGDMDYAKKLFYFSTKLIFILLFVIMLPFITEADYILEIWLGKTSEYMVDFTRLFLVYALILSLSDPITAIVQANGNVKSYYLKVDGFTLLSLPLIYVSYKVGAPANMSFIIAISVFIIAHLIRLSVLHELTGFSKSSYQKELMIPILFVSLLCSTVILLIHNSLPFGLVRLFVVTIASIALVVGTSMVIILDKSERSKIKEIIYNKLKK